MRDGNFYHQIFLSVVVGERKVNNLERLPEGWGVEKLNYSSFPASSIPKEMRNLFYHFIVRHEFSHCCLQVSFAVTTFKITPPPPREILPRPALFHFWTQLPRQISWEFRGMRQEINMRCAFALLWNFIPAVFNLQPLSRKQGVACSWSPGILPWWKGGGFGFSCLCQWVNIHGI